MKFITITLNPSLDKTLVTRYLAVGYHNRSEETKYLEPAGRGVNIGRALHQLECDTHAIILLGNDATGIAYNALITEESLEATCIISDGQTRSNTVILDISNGTETHITEEGPEVSEMDLRRVMKALKEFVTEGDFVICTGPLPAGSPPDTYAHLIEIAHQAGAQAIVATGEPALAEAFEAKPELVALQRIECEAFFNYPIRVKEDIISCARRFRTMGAGQALIEMRNAGRAVLATEAGEWEVDLQPFIHGSSSGVWDAMLAGFLAGQAKQGSLANKSLELGAAAAAYTASHVGNEFGSPQDIKEHITGVDVTLVDEEPLTPTLRSGS
jgi:1-phosphofructokinase family hexose kinase